MSVESNGGSESICVCATSSDESVQAEAVQMLSAVLQFEERHSSSDDDQSTEPLSRVLHTLALLYYLLHNNDKATRSASLIHVIRVHEINSSRRSPNRGQ